MIALTIFLKNIMQTLMTFKYLMKKQTITNRNQ